MRDSSFRISLDIHEVQSQVSLPVKTGDTARKILINLTENGAPYPIDNNCIAIFSAIKSDGKKIINDCIIEDNRIRYDITAQTVSAEGIVNAEIILYGEDEAVICSPRFDLVVDDRVVGVETISEDEKNLFDSFILSEQKRVANEQKRIEAYNNIDIDLKEDTDYFTVSVTKKDGTKEDVMIAKGKNSVSPAYISKKIDESATDEFVPSAKAVVEYSGITQTAKGNTFAIESIDAPLISLKAYSGISLCGKNIIDCSNKSTSENFKVDIPIAIPKGTILSASVYADNLAGFKNGNSYTIIAIWGDVSNREFEYVEVGTKLQHDCHTIRVNFVSTSFKNLGGVASSFSVQIELGNKATEFEAFQVQSLANTLHSVGDIKDEKDYSKGIKIKRVNAATISSLSTLSVVTLANGGKGLVVTPSDKKSAISGAVCTNAEYERGTLSYLDGTFYENKFNFVFCGTSSDTLETLTAKYGSAVLTYVIATEVETPISEAELSAYRQLHTYEGVTTIVGDAEVEYFGCNPNGKFASDLQSQIDDANVRIDDVLEETKFTSSASGKAITIESANAPLQALKLYGKTEQDGTPTPDNPIELKSVGDSGSFEVGVYGKNLFDINGNVNLWGHNGEHAGRNTVDGNILKAGTNASNTHAIGQKIKIGMDNTITFSAKLLSCGSGDGAQLAIYDGKNERQTIYIAPNGINQTYKITYTAKGEYLIFCFATFGGVGAEFTDIQVEFGQATPYEPCNKQTLTMPYTLRGVGDIKDEVDFTRGVKIQRFEKVIFNGSENWTINGVKQGYGLIWNNVGGDRTGFIPSTIVCDKLKAIGQGYLYDGVEKYIIATNGMYSKIYIRIDETITTVELLKQWLSNNPITVVYPLATPIETPISESELNAYRQLMTNKGNTTILSEADMEVDYYINKPNAQAIGNIHTQINKDYLKLQQAIITTGGNV
jgi:hypothetical protein